MLAMGNEDRMLIRYKNNIQDSEETLLQLQYKKEKIEKYLLCNKHKLADLVNKKENTVNCDDIFSIT
jgi:hypothetical protein